MPCGLCHLASCGSCWSPGAWTSQPGYMGSFCPWIYCGLCKQSKPKRARRERGDHLTGWSVVAQSSKPYVSNFVGGGRDKSLIGWLMFKIVDFSSLKWAQRLSWAVVLWWSLWGYSPVECFEGTWTQVNGLLRMLSLWFHLWKSYVTMAVSFQWKQWNTTWSAKSCCPKPWRPLMQPPWHVNHTDNIPVTSNINFLMNQRKISKFVNKTNVLP